MQSGLHPDDHEEAVYLHMAGEGLGNAVNVAAASTTMSSVVQKNNVNFPEPIIAKLIRAAAPGLYYFLIPGTA